MNLKAGRTYEFYCPIDGHKSLGMAGHIATSGASGSGSASRPQTSTSGGSGAGSRGAY